MIFAIHSFFILAYVFNGSSSTIETNIMLELKRSR
jgi:hypothetical protein